MPRVTVRLFGRGRVFVEVILRQGEAEVGLIGQKAGMDNCTRQPEAESFLDPPVAIRLSAIAAETTPPVVSHACLVKLRFELQIGVESIQCEVALPWLGARWLLRVGQAPAEYYRTQECNDPSGEWN